MTLLGNVVRKPDWLARRDWEDDGGRLQPVDSRRVVPRPDGGARSEARVPSRNQRAYSTVRTSRSTVTLISPG